MPNTLIIGYGNPLRGDDGFGWHVAERLQTMIQDPALEILAVHQLTPELMDPISRAGRVIFVDASVGPVPGEIRVRTVDPQAAVATAFSHHATPAALLAGARALYGHAPQATLITVTGTDFSLTDQLSNEVGCQMESAIAACLNPPKSSGV